MIYEEVRTFSYEDYIMLAFHKKWGEVFGDPMTFSVMVNKSRKLHLISTKSMYDVTGIKPILRKVKS